MPIVLSHFESSAIPRTCANSVVGKWQDLQRHGSSPRYNEFIKIYFYYRRRIFMYAAPLTVERRVWQSSKCCFLALFSNASCFTMLNSSKEQV